MASPLERLLAVARTKLGYVERGGRDGRSGNINDFAEELDPPLNGQSWCAIYVSWCFKHALIPLPRMDRDYGYMNCASAVTWAKRNGRFFTTPEVGDIVLYGTSGGTHTGIVSKVSRNGVDFMAIEGNTSPGPGLQPNGGMVMEKARTTKQYVYGFLRPDWAAWDRAPKIVRPAESIVHQPAIVMEPVVATLFTEDGKGCWHFSASGAEYAFGNAPHREWKTRAKDFVGRSVDHVELCADGIHPYVIVSDTGERYAP